MASIFVLYTRSSPEIIWYEDTTDGISNAQYIQENYVVSGKITNIDTNLGDVYRESYIYFANPNCLKEFLADLIISNNSIKRMRYNEKLNILREIRTDFS